MELFSSIVVFWLGLVGVVVATRKRWTPTERSLIWGAFFVHVAGSLAQLWITLSIYAGGDSLGYFRRASYYVDLITHAPFVWGPRVLAHTLQIDIGWPLSAFAGTSSGSMTGITVLPVLLTGKSVYATFLFFGILSFFGKLVGLRGIRACVPPDFRTRLCLTILFVPSVVFWTCGILKESVAVTGLGLAIYGLVRIVHRYQLKVGVPVLAIGMVLIGLVKPYILFPLSCAAGVWYYWQHGATRRRLTLVHLVVGAGLAIAGVVAFGKLFPQYAVENVSVEAGRLQEIGAEITGGTSYEIVETPERTMAGQLAYAPIALATSLFRPLPFEVVNLTSAINAVEVFLLTLLLIRALFARGGRRILRMITSNPVMMFAVVFTLISGIAIGLATTNLGTLSRYRVPMFPFYVLLIAWIYPVRERLRAAPPLQVLPGPGVRTARVSNSRK